jgi:ribosome recycling factor
LGQLARIAASKVRDYRASIEKLRKDAAEAALVRDLATDDAKRELYDRLHRHFKALADEVEQAVNSRAAE